MLCPVVQSHCRSSEEPAKNLLTKRPDGTTMVRVAGKASNWRRTVKIIQEASKERVVAKSKDAISQSSMSDRLSGLGEQMLGHGVYDGGASGSAASSAGAGAQVAEVAVVAKGTQWWPAASPAKKAEKDDDDDGNKDASSLDAFGSLVAFEQNVGGVAISPGKCAAAEAADKSAQQDVTPSKRGACGNAKSKAKVAAGKGKAQAKKKGRPGEGGFVKISGGLRRLQECTEVTGVAYFTSVWHVSTQRNWNNWLSALQGEMAECDPGMLDQLGKAERATKVVLKVLTANYKHGLEALPTLQVYQQ